VCDGEPRELGLLGSLAASPGVLRAVCCNCMLDGGKRNKAAAILTNVRASFLCLQGRVCRGGTVCDITAQQHDSWVPQVVNGEIVARVRRFFVR